MNSFTKIIDKIWQWTFHKSCAINKLSYVRYIFAIAFPFLSILATYFSVGTVKILYFPVFSPEQINCFLNSSASSFTIKW